MLLDQKTCENCKTGYDPLLDECPKCKEKNPNFESLKISKNIIVLPIYLEIVLFLIGSIGFQFIGTIFTEIILLKYGIDYDYTYTISSQAFINYGSYISLFVIFLIIFLCNFKKIIRGFKTPIKNELIGLIYGLGIVLFSILYSFFTEMLGFSSTNTNQLLIISVTCDYPILAIIVFAILGPFCEEVTYRVGLYTALRRFSKVFAYIITILVFTCIHFDFSTIIDVLDNGNTDSLIIELINLPAYIVGAFLLTDCYNRFGFSSSFAAHFINNMFSICWIIILSNIGG